MERLLYTTTYTYCLFLFCRDAEVPIRYRYRDEVHLPFPARLIYFFNCCQAGFLRVMQLTGATQELLPWAQMPGT